MRSLGILIAALFAALAPAIPAASSPSIEISHAWSRASAPSATTGAIYLTVANHGAGDDRLNAVSTPIAATAEIHRTLDENGVTTMPSLSALSIKAGGTAQFKPGAMHIMLFGLKRPLKAGESFPVTLTLEKAGALETTVTVEKAGAMGSNDMPGMMMKQ